MKRERQQQSTLSNQTAASSSADPVSGVAPTADFFTYRDTETTTPNLNDTPSKHENRPNKKRKLQFGQSSNISGDQKTKLYESFSKLDPNKLTEAKRMQTRHKQILKGKNTVGYDEYCKKVPKHSRKRISEHPSTPDYKLDIPNRRWLGLVKAWRISLHQYDPKDLKGDLFAENKKDCDSVKLQPRPQSIQEQQIAQAFSRGLQVDFGASDDNDDDGHAKIVDHHKKLNNNDPQETKQQCEEEKIGLKIGDSMDNFGRVEVNREANDTGEDDGLILDYDDSDDDLL